MSDGKPKGTEVRLSPTQLAELSDISQMMGLGRVVHGPTKATRPTKAAQLAALDPATEATSPTSHAEPSQATKGKEVATMSNGQHRRPVTDGELRRDAASGQDVDRLRAALRRAAEENDPDKADELLAAWEASTREAERGDGITQARNELAQACQKNDRKRAQEARARWRALLPGQEPEPEPEPELVFDMAQTPEPNWLVKAFGWVAGAPHLVAGYGYSGKTFAMQSAALSITAGRAVWGYYPSRKGAVLHLDYEQGPRVTIERYQRLLSGMGLTRSDVGRLEYQCCSTTGGPHQLTVGAADAERLERRMVGRDLLIIDSLRAAVGGLDENDSRIREPLDLLGRLSRSTGCAVVLVHHARKLGRDEQTQEARFAVRGSSAIFDACASVLVLTGKKDEPKTVCQEKARESRPIDDFALTISDVDDNARSIVVSTLGMEAVHEARAATAEQKEAARLDALTTKAVSALRSAMAAGMTTSALRDAMQVRGADAAAVAQRLVAAGRAELVRGPRGANFYRLTAEGT